jgi:hypothetical protein
LQSPPIAAASCERQRCGSSVARGVWRVARGVARGVARDARSGAAGCGTDLRRHQLERLHRLRRPRRRWRRRRWRRRCCLRLGRLSLGWRPPQALRFRLRRRFFPWALARLVLLLLPRPLGREDPLGLRFGGLHRLLPRHERCLEACRFEPARFQGSTQLGHLHLVDRLGQRRRRRRRLSTLRRLAGLFFHLEVGSAHE